MLEHRGKHGVLVGAIPLPGTPAVQSLQEGKLSDALDALQSQVRNNPSEAKLRIFLFQLLAVMGEWKRAMTQLEVAGELDGSSLAMVNTYREVIRCEVFRQGVFAGKRLPLILGEPLPWVALLLDALRLLSQDDFGQSQQLRAQAFEMARASSGKINAQPFSWIADADMRLGPLLEAIINGRYYWIPFQYLRSIEIDAPEDLRDVVWMPATITLVNGGEFVGLIPSRYPGSETSADSSIRLARKTEWSSPGPNIHVALGQRMLATNQGEYPLMDIRSIALDAEATPEVVDG
ncbi:MAG: virulence protein SciE type [Gammaproteobacteria bacterium]|nr:virulence protein SciE type [Gammaproteobacteria bacterium]